MSRYRIDTSTQSGWITPDNGEPRTKNLAPGWLLLLGIGQVVVGVAFVAYVLSLLVQLFR